jgi:hypothetical protein
MIATCQGIFCLVFPDLYSIMMVTLNQLHGFKLAPPSKHNSNRRHPRKGNGSQIKKKKKKKKLPDGPVNWGRR